MNACDKYYWIHDHPAFINPEFVKLTLEIDPHMVCPTTNRVEDFTRLNTKHQLWVEVMVPHYDEDTKLWGHAHDWTCDTGGDTWEEMIEKLYDLIVEKYGEYTDDDVNKKNFEVHGYRVMKQTNKAKNRTARIRWNLTPPKWSDDIIKPEYREIMVEEEKEIQETIRALGEYRKSCDTSEYEAVDKEIERNQYILFEQQLSMQTGIDLVRK